MRDFQVGRRTNELMTPVVAGMTRDVMRELADHSSDFKARTRTNDAGTMTSVAGTLNAQDIPNLAHDLVGL